MVASIPDLGIVSVLGSVRFLQVIPEAPWCGGARATRSPATGPTREPACPLTVAWARSTKVIRSLSRPRSGHCYLTTAGTGWPACRKFQFYGKWHSLQPSKVNFDALQLFTSHSLSEIHPRCPGLIRTFTKCSASRYKSCICFISAGVAREPSPDAQEARVAAVPPPAPGAGLVGPWGGMGPSDSVLCSKPPPAEPGAALL